jgi:tetratricopeptide (TPR) repeat protein
MYKNDRAIETIKRVIYSVDTPQSLMVKACIVLGDIYSEMKNAQDAFAYYKKALESLDENVEEDTLAELYFKYALACDDKGDVERAFDFYNKCIALEEKNLYKALAYSNLASCYYENDSYEDARFCFEQAYNIEKENNNFDGIYYNALHIAKILEYMGHEKALEFYVEAKKSAEFINEDFYIMESTIALGDYYYNKPKSQKEALVEYFKAKKIASRISQSEDLKKIKNRINDMKLRMKSEDFTSIENKYDR